MLPNLQSLHCLVSSVQSYLKAPTFNLVTIEHLTNKKCKRNNFLQLHLTLTLKFYFILCEQCYESVLVLPTSKPADKENQLPDIY